MATTYYEPPNSDDRSPFLVRFRDFFTQRCRRNRSTPQPPKHKIIGISSLAYIAFPRKTTSVSRSPFPVSLPPLILPIKQTSYVPVSVIYSLRFFSQLQMMVKVSETLLLCHPLACLSSVVCTSGLRAAIRVSLRASDESCSLMS